MKMVLTFQSLLMRFKGDGVPDNPGDVIWENQ